MRENLNVKLLLAILSWTCGNIVNNTALASNNCSTGLFGKKCHLRCFCRGSEHCKENGECEGPLFCDNKHFGPGCQYVDLAVTQGDSANELYLSDHNETTCNPNTDILEALVKLKEECTVLWFRISIKHPKLHQAFSISFDTDRRLACVNETRYKIPDSDFTDVFCQFSQKIQVVNIHGEGVRHLCSVYISGGRNLALNTEMLSSNTRVLVDGVTDKSCLPVPISGNHTQKINFDAFLVQSVSIYVGNSDGSNIPLSVSLANDKNEIYPVSKIVSTKNQKKHHLPVSPPVCVHQIVVHVQADTGKSTTIVLCEIELYGEKICGDKQYGLECSGVCSTCKTSCSSVSGLCTPECPMFKYGPGCSKRCNQSCLDQRCKAASGECYNCQIGYAGPSCDKPCSNETWGADCMFHCSNNCGKDICDSRTGFCTVCNEGMEGRNCQKCRDGRYGDRCALSCSDHCLDHVCDILNGTCLQCEGQRFGSQCSECPEKFFGSKCLSKCSEHCLKGTCHKDTGNCSPCKPGYRGPQCRIDSTDKIPLYVLAPVALLFTFLAVVVLFCVQRTLKRSSIAEQISTS